MKAKQLVSESEWATNGIRFWPSFPLHRVDVEESATADVFRNVAHPLTPPQPPTLFHFRHIHSSIVTHPPCFRYFPLCLSPSLSFHFNFI